MNPNDFNPNQAQAPQFFNTGAAPMPAPTHNKKKTFWIILVLIVILAILSLGGIYLWGQMTVNNTPVTTETSEDVENSEIGLIENDLAGADIDLSSEFNDLENTF